MELPDRVFPIHCSRRLAMTSLAPRFLPGRGYAKSRFKQLRIRFAGLTPVLDPPNLPSQNSKEANNSIEPDHRSIKSRRNAMLGFKRLRSASTTISGIELTHRIGKGQFDLAKLGLKKAAAPAVWNAVPSDR
jgi:hypothetical protein